MPARCTSPPLAEQERLRIVQERDRSMVAEVEGRTELAAQIDAVEPRSLCEIQQMPAA